MRILLVVLLSFVLSGSAAFACDFQVTPNGLGHTLTIQEANSRASAGKTICISTGTYTQQIKPSSSGTNGNPITYKLNPGSTTDGVVFEGTDTMVSFNGKSHIVVDGIKIVIKSGLKSSPAVAMTGNHNTLKNTVITRTGPNLDQSDPRAAVMARFGANYKGAGVQISGDDNVVDSNDISYLMFGVKTSKDTFRNKILNNTIMHTGQSSIVVGTSHSRIQGLLIEGNYMEGSWVEDGIQWHQDFTQDSTNITNFGTIVRGNTFRYMSENALDFKSVRYAVIEGNLFHKTIGSNNGGMEGFRPQDNKQSCSTRNDGTVTDDLPVYDENNRDQQSGVIPCWMSWGGGVATFGRGANTRSDHAIIRHNVVYDSAGGISNKGTNYKIYNNTLLGNNVTFFSDSASNFNGFAFNSGSGAGTVFMNNIIGGHNGGDVKISGSSAALQISHNLYWGSSPHNLDSNTQTGNPNLKNISSNKPKGTSRTIADFALTSESSNALNKGGYLTKVTRDSSNDIIAVVDPLLFTDGYGITQGDEIIILHQGTKITARILEINYGNKTLKLNKNVTVSTNDPVTYHFTGSAPDIGATVGSGPGNPNPTTEPSPAEECSPTDPDTHNPNINGQGSVDILDFSILISDFMEPIDTDNPDNPAPGKAHKASDINCDQEVNILDYSILITNFGT